MNISAGERWVSDVKALGSLRQALYRKEWCLRIPTSFAADAQPWQNTKECLELEKKEVTCIFEMVNEDLILIPIPCFSPIPLSN